MKKQRKIKILFDAGPLVNGNKTGVGRTTEGLVLALARKYPSEVELVGHYFDFLDQKDKTHLPHAPNIRYRRTVLVPGKVLNMLRRLGVWVPFELLVKERGDFHIFPGFIGWPSFFRTPNAPFVHDITYIEYPQYVNGPARFDLKTIMPRTIKRSTFIITNSESSRSGLTREYELSKKPVLVEHIPPVNAIKISSSEARKRVKDLGIIGSYILFFGTLEPRKNLVGLIEAYSRLSPPLKEKYSLVIGGGKGWKDEAIIHSIENLTKHGDKVVQTGYVSDKDRAALFMDATIYIMPSHYEGFGMQALEAMTYETPIIASDIPVLREVCQKAAVYSGTAAPELERAISKLLASRTKREQLIREGNHRLSEFSWDKVADDIYKKIVSSIRT